jgi:hypothetical protein
MFETIDWELLRLQKQWLLGLRDLGEAGEMSEGLVSLLDALQDHAVESGAVSELDVFGQYQTLD